MNNRKMVNLAQELDKIIKQIIEIQQNQAIVSKTSYGDDLWVDAHKYGWCKGWRHN
jgi:hypothetical protein